MRGVDALDVIRGLDMGEGDLLPLTCCGDLGWRSGLPMGETGQETFLGVWTSLDIRKKGKG